MPPLDPAHRSTAAARATEVSRQEALAVLAETQDEVLQAFEAGKPASSISAATRARRAAARAALKNA